MLIVQDVLWMATTSVDGGVKIWDSSTGEVVQSLGGHQNGVRHGKFGVQDFSRFLCKCCAVYNSESFGLEVQNFVGDARIRCFNIPGLQSSFREFMIVMIMMLYLVYPCIIVYKCNTA